MSHLEHSGPEMGVQKAVKAKFNHRGMGSLEKINVRKN
jgi:hypothetical protein